MSPVFRPPNIDFPEEIDRDEIEEDSDTDMAYITLWYSMVLVCIIVLWMLMYMLVRVLALRQKTRNPQQRRTYMGTRSRTSLPPSEPTIYVSPANLPPPPKYEAMAPPSYEEVVGIHYPPYQPPQPINQPIVAALATQSSNSASNVSSNVTSNVNSDVANNVAINVSNNEATTTVANETTTITTVDERRPVTAAT